MRKKLILLLTLLLILPIVDAGSYHLNVTSVTNPTIEGKMLKARFRVELDSDNTQYFKDLDKIETILYCNDLEPVSYQQAEPTISDDATSEYLVGVQVPDKVVQDDPITCSLHIEAKSDVATIKNAFVDNIEVKKDFAWESMLSRAVDWVEKAFKSIKEIFVAKREV